MFIPGAVEKPVLRIPPRTRESGKFPTQHHNRFRVTVVEIDSAGIGVMPKHPAADDGCATIPNIARYWKEFILGEFSLPNMGALGLGNIANIAGVPPAANPAGAFGALSLDSAMTDTPTGHWSAMGRRTKEYPTFLNGIPRPLLEEIETEVSARLGEEFHFLKDGRNISGTTILEENGTASQARHEPIVYTSSDSVFQIAWHIGKELGKDEIVLTDENTAIIREEETNNKTGLVSARTFAVNKTELDKLYKVCQIVREVLNESPDPEKHFLRVIARPFASRAALGEKGEKFVRSTSLRRDYGMPPPGPTILNYAMQAGFFTGAVGKIYDLFTGSGITRSWPDPSEHRHLKGDMEGIDFLLQALSQDTAGILFVNLVDCDEQYGHRNDPVGYAKNLMAIDARLPEIFANMRPWDLLIITADHGNDPTRGLVKMLVERQRLDKSFLAARGTNHTREFVPLIVCGNPVLAGADLGINQMSDLGATIANYLGFNTSPDGVSFLDQLIDRNLFLG